MISIESIISFISGFFSMGLAIFVLLRDRRIFLHRVFSAGMIAFAVEAILTALSIETNSSEMVNVLQRIRLFIESLIPPIWLIFSLSFAREDYRESLRRMKWLIVLCFAIPLVGGSIFNWSLITQIALDEHSRWIIGLGFSGQILQIVILVTTVIVLMNLERILRLSKGHVRWQIKFMIIGLGGIFALRIYTGSQALMFKSIDTSFEVVNSCSLIIANILILRSLFRLKMLSIEIYPSQAVIYSSITIILVGIYFIVAGILVNLFKYLGISQALALRVFLIFLAFLGLFVLLLSDRVRHKIRYFISVHMKRPKYDYRKEWMKFTEQTSMITDPGEFCMKVARMISDTLEVLSVTVWLFDETNYRLKPAGSTVFSGGELGHKISEKFESKLIEIMKDQDMPVDLDNPYIPWAKELKNSLPEALTEARIRYCARLFAGGRLLGFITLGERVGYEPFYFEEFDLLKTMADEIAGSILNLKLSEELRKAKEMEAFQTISAFMIHDLKNIASTLSLTMQNMPVHFEKPEFREDALRVIKQSVNKVNNMCGQLSLLTKKIELKKVETDLNDLILNCLPTVNGGERISISHELSPIPKIYIDQEQIQKVLTNLLLNAHEALINGGEINVKTYSDKGWVMVSVKDNGCGMTKEFIEHSLFKPFKTTKKNGMGIGLYQSKMIVEAHGGKIEVESQPNAGTTFRVYLPIK